MPTFRSPIEDGQILLAASVTDASQPSEVPNAYPALLDTGAQSTMISPKVVADVGLTAIGYAQIVPVSGQPIQTEKYRAGISIPISRGTATLVTGMDLEVAVLPFQPNNFDILLGMDFLMAFHFTMYDGMFILSN